MVVCADTLRDLKTNTFDNRLDLAVPGYYAWKHRDQGTKYIRVFWALFAHYFVRATASTVVVYLLSEKAGSPVVNLLLKWVSPANASKLPGFFELAAQHQSLGGGLIGLVLASAAALTVNMKMLCALQGPSRSRPLLQRGLLAIPVLNFIIDWCDFCVDYQEKQIAKLEKNTVEKILLRIPATEREICHYAGMGKREIGRDARACLLRLVRRIGISRTIETAARIGEILACRKSGRPQRRDSKRINPFGQIECRGKAVGRLGDVAGTGKGVALIFGGSDVVYGVGERVTFTIENHRRFRGGRRLHGIVRHVHVTRDSVLVGVEVLGRSLAEARQIIVNML